MKKRYLYGSIILFLLFLLLGIYFESVILFIISVVFMITAIILAPLYPESEDSPQETEGSNRDEDWEFSNDSPTEEEISTGN